jgi:hypothetical protein
MTRLASPVKILKVIYNLCPAYQSIKAVNTAFQLGTKAAIAFVFSRQLLSIDIDQQNVQNMALSHHRTLPIYY